MAGLEACLHMLAFTEVGIAETKLCKPMHGLGLVRDRKQLTPVTRGTSLWNPIEEAQIFGVAAPPSVSISDHHVRA